jgi:hypothetical protein
MNWIISKCVKNFEVNDVDPECGGFSERGEDTKFKDAYWCCEQMLPWKNLIGHSLFQ